MSRTSRQSAALTLAWDVLYCCLLCVFLFTWINPILKRPERFLHTASCNTCQKNKWLCKWQLWDAWDAVIYKVPAVHTETNLSAISDFLWTAQALWVVNYFPGLSSHTSLTQEYLHTRIKSYPALQKVIATYIETTYLLLGLIPDFTLRGKHNSWPSSWELWLKKNRLLLFLVHQMMQICSEWSKVIKLLINFSWT